MSILSTELIAYGAASRPEDDASTSGGAIDALNRPEFTQWASGNKVSLTSDGTDTRSVDIKGRLATGVLTSETVVLTNASEVLSTNTYERVLYVRAQTTSGTRTVTIKEGAGGTTRGTIPINEKGVFAMFIASASSTSGVTDRYEKIFWKNTNGSSLTLTSSTMTLTADPSSKIKIGIETSIDDSTTVSNRITVPSNPTFVDDGVAQNLPSSGNLAASSAIGTWIKQTLAQNDSAFKSTFTTQLAGNTI